MDHVYARLQPIDGYPPHEVEELDAEPAGDGTFVIRSVPVWARDLSRADRVRTTTVDGLGWMSTLTQ